jgi:hypothetical protein
MFPWVTALFIPPGYRPAPYLPYHTTTTTTITAAITATTATRFATVQSLGNRRTSFRNSSPAVITTCKFLCPQSLTQSKISLDRVDHASAEAPSSGRSPTIEEANGYGTVFPSHPPLTMAFMTFQISVR